MRFNRARYYMIHDWQFDRGLRKSRFCNILTVMIYAHCQLELTHDGWMLTGAPCSRIIDFFFKAGGQDARSNLPYSR